ncbi:hypothetical protein VTL71DRAFT_1831 [Oculimacula yallundae]|uniref:Uncharacterized protein n=1 Tax=Oculimacula yallundae TaxID=86028 RepID=A0ABR4CBT2_9HELO
MAPTTLLLLSILFPFVLAAPAPARPAAALIHSYEIVLTVPALPLPSHTSPQPAQKVTTQISIITPAPELRHRQWSEDLLPTETETEYYWDGETPYSWPAGDYPPWLPPSIGNTIVNTGQLTVTLGRREEDNEREKRQLSPITYTSGGWGNSVLPVETEKEPGYWGDGKTFTFAGQTFTIGGTGKLTITLGKPGGGVGARTAAVEERQELSYEGGSTTGVGDGGETVTDVPTITYTDAVGEVRTLTVGGSSDSVAFTQVPT